jgi:hypothetical protein
MCTVLLPPDVKPIAVKEYNTSYNYRMKQPTSLKNMGFTYGQNMAEKYYGRQNG